jgi:3-oxoacyl-[acyl-carrier protein] reductase
MDLGITGKVAMVAAGSKGIGRACALALAREGCRVSICARGADTLEDARAEISAHGEVLAVQADVSAAADLENWHRQTRDHFGDADILVTNTGGPPVARFHELSDEQWRAGVESTLMNVVRLSRLALPAMQQRRWGRVIHLTSLVAKQPMEELTISSTLRAGLSALTKTMANEFGPDGVTVNAVLLGHVRTDRQMALAAVRMREWGVSEEEYFRRSAAAIPLRRIAEPREVGDLVAFLASGRAAYITGASLPIDGGSIKSSL